MSQIERAPFEAKRRVIDVSGDGDDDNSGGDVALVRDRVLAEGITINALVVSEDQPLVWENGAAYPGDDLERYYREKVIGGPGAFVMVAKDYPSFWPSHDQEVGGRDRRSPHDPCPNGAKRSGGTAVTTDVGLGVVCHEHRHGYWRCATVREMKEGPSGSAIRSRSQATASCCGQNPWW